MAIAMLTITIITITIITIIIITIIMDYNKKPLRSMGGLNRDQLRSVHGTIVSMDNYTDSANRVGGALYVGMMHARRKDGHSEAMGWKNLWNYIKRVSYASKRIDEKTNIVMVNAKIMTQPLRDHIQNYQKSMSFKSQLTWLGEYWFAPHKDYTLCGWSSASSNAPFYPKNVSEAPITTKHCVHILITGDEHADILLKLPKFLMGTSATRSASCKLCLQPYSTKWLHNCRFKCYMCGTVGKACSKPWDPITCDVCNRRMANISCMQAHFDNGLCGLIHKCPKCKSAFKPSSGVHKCRKTFSCKVCELEADPEHLHCNFPNDEADFKKRHQFSCFVPAYKVKKKKRELFITFDIETEQSLAMSNESTVEVAELTPELLDANIHKVICVCAQVFCRECMHNSGGDPPCDKCPERDKVFYGSNALDKFCEWLFSAECKGRTVFAHNYGRFDAVFLTKWLLDHGYHPHIVSVGLRIVRMSLTKHDILFLDSYNYLPFSLAELAKSFAKGVALKGFFPYMSTPPNDEFSVESGLPPKHMYCADGFKSERMKAGEVSRFEEFNAWYAEHKDDPFNYRQECIKYCMNDVDILRISVITFMTMFEKICDDMCCWANGCTISATVNNFYRASMMPVGKIPIISNNEQYHREGRQSRVGIVYIKCMMEYMNLDIDYIRNTGEVILAGRYPTDGVVVCPITKRVTHIFNFDGCHYHGCTRCYPKGRERIMFGSESIDSLRTRTVERDRMLRSKYPNAIMIVKRSCDFIDDIANDAKLAAIYKRVSEQENVRDLDDVTPLNCRNAYFGGRSECYAAILEADVDSGQELGYIDICSAYPYALRECEFGVGHPKLVTDKLNASDYNTPDAFNFWGFIKCRVLAPQRGAHHHQPLLPMRMGKNNLYFTLCAKCAKLKRHNVRCTHNERERSWIGTYDVMEVKLAIQNGYQVQEVFEIWRWAETMQIKKSYDPVTQEWTIDDHGLYSLYVQTFLRIKHMAAGFPAHVLSDEQKHAHLDDLFKKDGIRLEISEVHANKQLYIMVKLALNSFYGKLAQRAGGRSIHEYVTNVDRFNYLNNANGVSLDIMDATIMNENCFHYQYKMRDSHLDTLKHSCVPHAAHITSNIRCIMYEQLSRLNKRVLACDTDSIIYIKMRPPPPSGGSEESESIAQSRIKYELTYGKEDCYYEPPIGNALGTWGNEFAEDALCYAGYSTGSKSYALLSRKRASPYTELPSTVRCKGLTITNRTECHLNAIAYKNMILKTLAWLNKSIASDCDDENSTHAGDYTPQPCRMVQQVKFIKTFRQQMFTRDSVKSFRCTFTKRMVVRDADGSVSPITWPWGHLDCFPS